MATLGWRDEDNAILSSAAVLAGKKVTLTGDGYAELPGAFDVYRTFGSVARRVRQKRGKPELAPVQSLTPNQEPPSAARSDRWRIPPPPHRLKWRLLFEDDRLNRSPILPVSRLGSIDNAGGGFAGASLSLGFKVITAIDPRLRLSLVTPWGEGDESLHGHLRELEEDEAEEPEEANGAMLEYMERFLPSEPPAGWEFSVTPDALELDEGGSAHVTVEIQFPTPGVTAFALQMAVEGEEELAAVSDVLAVEVPEDLQHASLLFADDDQGGPGAENMLSGVRVVDVEEGSLRAVMERFRSRARRATT
jgi:hypothetical protein